MINLTITRIETLASDDSNNFKFNQIYKKIVTIFTANYGVKQSQFTKLTLESLR